MNKTNLNIYLIFVCKYRKRLLDKINIKPILEDIANKSDFKIRIMESDLDHIHMIINYPPTLSVT